METIQKLILPLVVLVWLSIYGYTHMIIPSYPTVDSEYSLVAIEKIVGETIENEIKIQGRLLQMKEISNDDYNSYKQEVIKVATKLDKCTSKECFIEAYEDFMSNNVSDATKKYTRFENVKQLGAIGNLINESFQWTY